MKAFFKRFISLLPSCLLLLVGCKDTIEYNYIFDSDVVIEDGEKNTESSDPFSQKGIYADPELKIDGVRDAEYDYPSGSGRHKVYASETEDAYVSIYKGERGIYYLFECKDDCLSTLNVENINLATAQSDSVELYVDTYGTGGNTRGSNQYEFRVTAAGRIYSYLTGFVARVFTYGTLNFHTDVDQGFNVEGYISYSVLGDDVDKYTPTSFAFARVTKTGNKGYLWHGDVDPQVPDNYLILNPYDNKFYTQKAYPVTGVVSGRLVDVNNNAVPAVKVSVDGYKTVYTDDDGKFSLNIKDCVDDITINYSKTSYLKNQTKVSKKSLRLAKNNTIDLGDSLFLKEDDASYTSTMEGKVTERDGKTPISNVKVSVNDTSVQTDSNGDFSFNANLYGYSNTLKFEKDDHLTYEKNIAITDTNIGAKTNISSIQLDENKGSQIGFGREETNLATARMVRGDDSFKVVLKTESNMDVSEVPGSNFELFIDTKGSNSMNKRDSTDYLFVLQYADEGVLSTTNYGGKAINARNIKTSYGRINEEYYVEADIPYSVIDVEKDEVFGVYFGIKQNYNWTGMYDTGDTYIQAEATVNYVRFDADSNFFQGSSNTEPAKDMGFKKIGRIGEFTEKVTPQYDVSYSRNGGTLMLKLDLVDNGIKMTDQSHSLNVYADMNASASKTKKDSNNYHISIYPGRPTSIYKGWNESENKEDSKTNYEIDAENTWAYLYKNSIYVKIDTSIFGGEENNPIGFALGMWSDAVGKNSILSYNGKECSFDNPSNYFIVTSDGEISIA